MTTIPTSELTRAGVSIWLDDLSRRRLDAGEIERLITDYDVSGVTTNPSIFQLALAESDAYQEQLEHLAAAGVSSTEAVTVLTTTDVRCACDIFAPIYASSGGKDGRVSIEVDPGKAHDSEATIAEARALYRRIDRENLLVKIPATREGLAAITQTLAEGISVNVTLIFSLQRYREVIDAYMSGIEQALEAGREVATIHSVASFFVSRLDTGVDRRLDTLGTPAASELRGQAGLANARLAYRLFCESIASERWERLSAAGAHPQRPLWASTGVKDPQYPDTMYVTELVAPQTVNTVPEKTLTALAEHGLVHSDTITEHYEHAQRCLEQLAELGISYEEVVDRLEREGVEKFVASWEVLLQQVSRLLSHYRREARPS